MKNAKSSKRRRGQKGSQSDYEVSLKRRVAVAYFEGSKSAIELASMYNIPREYVYRWCKQFSCELREEIIIIPMTHEEQKDFELLKKQNEALKKKLEYEQMKNFALETMVDLAKSELGIDLRKKSGAKQPKE